MKRLFGFLALVAASVATAHAANTATIPFTGQSAESITLDSVKYRTEFHERDVVRTCYHEVFRGYVWDCPGGGYPRPYPGPGPGPGGPRPRPRPGYPGPRGPGPGYPAPGSSCRQIPVYDRVPYSCVQRERFPVQVFDANVTARLDMTFEDLPEGVTANETFVATLDGDQLNVSVRGSGKLLISERMNASAARLGQSIEVTAKASYSFHDAAPIAAAFRNGMSGVSVVGGKVNLNMSSLLPSVASGMHLTVVRERALASDKAIVNRLLPFGVFALTESGTPGGPINLKATYASLGIPRLGKGKYEFTFSMSAGNFGGRLMNADQFVLRTSSVINLKVK